MTDGWRMLLQPVREVGGLTIWEKRPAIEMDAAVPQAAGVMYVEPNGRVLLLRRTDVGDRAGTWAFPGGKIEHGELPRQAAARESDEEIGRKPTDLSTLTLLSKGEGNYHTFKTHVAEKFEPELNDEHDDWQWASPEDLPEPLHPGVAKMFAEIGKGPMAHDEQTCIVESSWAYVLRVKDFALDRASVRTTDTDGRLHVAVTPISKATVNPYFGREIPGYEELGLDPGKKYMMLRHPEELAKAAGTFNNLPILNEHVPVSADSHQPELIIGSTGTDAKFESPYLYNSLVFWAKSAIDDIQARDSNPKLGKKELSCAYRYRPDMTSGTYEGQRYDGIMRDLIGNHLALVKEGRAGPDVVVGDSKLKETTTMAAKPMSRMAAMLMGATAAFIAPKLAKDEKVDLQPIFRRVTPKNYKDAIPKIVEAVEKAVDGHLAFDATPEGLHTLLEALSKVAPKEDEIPAAKAEGMGPVKGEIKDADPAAVLGGGGGEEGEAEGEGGEEEGEGEGGLDPMEAIKSFIRANMNPEAFAKLEEMMKAAQGGGGSMAEGAPGEDEEPDNMPKDLPKPGGGKDRMMTTRDRKPPAMDEDQVQKMIKAAVAGEQQRNKELREAEQFILPYVGRLAVTFDSAEGIYREALKIKRITADPTWPITALRTLLSTQKKMSEEKTTTATPAHVAQDSASVDDYHKMFGNEHIGFA